MHLPRRPSLFAALALASAASAACASERDEAWDDRVIEGRVQDERAGSAIAGATVSFVSDTLDRAETVSDGEGRFTLEVELSEGVRFGTLVAAHAGYARSAPRSVYFDGTALRLDLTLRPRD